MVKNMKCKTIRILSFDYDTFEEQVSHVKDMIKDGWAVANFKNLNVEYSKIEDERQIN